MTPCLNIKYEWSSSSKSIIQENNDGKLTLIIIELIEKTGSKILRLNLKEKAK